jgi:hypothetical protein
LGIEVQIPTETENKTKVNVIHQNQKPSPQNAAGRNTKTLKIQQIICTLLAPSVRYNLASTYINECKETGGSYNMQLAVLTLLVRVIEMLR